MGEPRYAVPPDHAPLQTETAGRSSSQKTSRPALARAWSCSVRRAGSRTPKFADDPSNTDRSVLGPGEPAPGGHAYHPRVNTPSPTRPLVIGLAGGIGAGKSAVASAFARAGCAVIDSDAEAKAALDRPEVQRELVGWWGPSIVHPDGRTDRAAVARVVFDRPDERRRLESLIHPLIRRTRPQAQDEARRAGAPAIIYDAPLLFEAGLDRLCDAVVFVECPRDERLRRLQRSRGWDAQEVARREAAQLPPDEKRRRSTHVIDNPGGTRLDSRAAELLAILLTQASTGFTGLPGSPNG